MWMARAVRFHYCAACCSGGRWTYSVFRISYLPGGTPHIKSERETARGRHPTYTIHYIHTLYTHTQSVRQQYTTVQPAMETPVKQLTLAHHNRHYSHLLRDILHIYGNVTPRTVKKIATANLSDIDSDSIVISFTVPDIALPIDKVILYPADCLVGSDNEKFTRLLLQTVHRTGKSLVKLNTCLPPGTLPDFLVLLLVPLPVVCYFFDQLLLYIPLFGEALYNNPNYLRCIIALELLCHLCESLVFLRPLMYKYSVPFDLQIEWYMWGLLEGYGPVRRINQHIGSNSK
ncbi:similar to Saccharomyces cerevisiae YDR476C Putative protein of unknown function [Maudiozyma barnettii]|uniref:DUF2470 domain-containing protein n=1 Tax=Maudiozyma barnettii TaxID=61262 RepID=A0A8H2ZIY8_9SACH|nr:hypothetical protein [Kazachstania barnettii]CAB4256007.1 similar to Saccharomyces cerevisiae YDR476C Putative protein of unknown function [Kazachstania barnettii]CAD1784615.1 similar to Saccharomyces cerevisiae YDR476C Putative protein of unknown function [Kazachstania barnettii]